MRMEPHFSFVHPGSNQPSPVGFLTPSVVLLRPPAHPELLSALIDWVAFSRVLEKSEQAGSALPRAPAALWAGGHSLGCFWDLYCINSGTVGIHVPFFVWTSVFLPLTHLHKTGMGSNCVF